MPSVYLFKRLSRISVDSSISHTLPLKFKKGVVKIMSAFRKSVHETSSGDSRKRQSKRDDAIRRRIEHDLAKKRPQNSKATRTRKGAPGTVMSLRPSDPILCKPLTTVYEAAQLMSARRENCILVADDQGDLVGIFTAKDLAFRIVGASLNANSTTIDLIMTPSPLCANASSPASDALTLMVSKGFRHLPVLDDDNHIVGVLDITKSYAQQMEKLERMQSSSKRLSDALDSVHLEISGAAQPAEFLEYIEDLKSKMSGPTLASVLDHTTQPVYTSVKSSVYEATILMKENRTTAVLVRDNQGEVTGIFTSKDVVLRVIAAGLDPKKCSIVRVMTPQPDVSPASTSIQTALRQMFEGHYLNLPVVDEDHEIIGIVDVLRLTYVTLNQIQKLELDASKLDPEKPAEGPAWNNFWVGLDKDDSDSFHSSSHLSGPNVTPSEFELFNLDQKEIRPSDSISATGESFALRPEVASIPLMMRTESFTFKFKSPAIAGRVHRVTVKEDTVLKDLRSVIDEKLHPKDIEVLGLVGQDDETYAVSYVDDEGDVVSITCDDDLQDCIRIYQAAAMSKADLYLHHPHKHAPVEETKRQVGKSKNAEIIPGLDNVALISGVVGVVSAIAAVAFITNRKA